MSEINASWLIYYKEIHLKSKKFWNKLIKVAEENNKFITDLINDFARILQIFRLFKKVCLEKCIKIFTNFQAFYETKKAKFINEVQIEQTKIFKIHEIFFRVFIKKFQTT